MNEHDRDNLRFLLSADRETFMEWAEQVTQDDMDYAMELLAQYAEELAVRSHEMMVECMMETEDYSEANAVINRIKSL